MKHGMKVIERVFERRLKKVVGIDEMQMGFLSGKGTVRQMMEKY